MDNLQASNDSTQRANSPHTQPVCVKVTFLSELQEMPCKSNHLEQSIPFQKEDYPRAKKEALACVVGMSRMQFGEAVAPEGYD
jgi:hypothetical protein